LKESKSISESHFQFLLDYFTLMHFFLDSQKILCLKITHALCSLVYLIPINIKKLEKGFILKTNITFLTNFLKCGINLFSIKEL
jgi:hypothetical protein